MRRRASRPAFALAIVVLLAGVVVIACAIMLERHAAGRLNLQRELKVYEAHHAGRGLSEVTTAWIMQIPTGAVSQLLGEEGHAFDLVLDDRSVVSVSLVDGQGTLLADPSLVASGEREDLIGIRDQLLTLTGYTIPAPMLRQVGPLKISAMTAPEELLEAVILHVTGGEGAEGFVRQVLGERADGELKDLDLSKAINDAGLSGPARTQLRRLLSAEPTLWQVKAELTPRGAREPTEVYVGMAIIEPRGGIRGRGSTFSPWGPFLSWERVEVDEVR
jgi:hypothetical protein